MGEGVDGVHICVYRVVVKGVGGKGWMEYTFVFRVVVVKDWGGEGWLEYTFVCIG